MATRRRPRRVSSPVREEAPSGACRGRTGSTGWVKAHLRPGRMRRLGPPSTMYTCLGVAAGPSRSSHGPVAGPFAHSSGRGDRRPGGQPRSRQRPSSVGLPRIGPQEGEQIGHRHENPSTETEQPDGEGAPLGQVVGGVRPMPMTSTAVSRSVVKPRRRTSSRVHGRRLGCSPGVARRCVMAVRGSALGSVFTPTHGQPVGPTVTNRCPARPNRTQPVGQPSTVDRPWRSIWRGVAGPAGRLRGAPPVFDPARRRASDDGEVC